jgi:hypothetical protein
MVSHCSSISAGCTSQDLTAAATARRNPVRLDVVDILEDLFAGKMLDQT